MAPLLWGFTVFGQINSWQSQLGGDWHDVNSWSAGILPGTNQSILITNAGTKTVRMGPQTTANYRDTLHAESVTVSAPNRSRNTLLLDSIETNQFLPGRMEIGERGELAVASSAMLLGELQLHGAAAQWGDSSVSLNTFYLAEGGVYNLIEGALRAGRYYIGSTWWWAGEGENLHQEILPGVFNQYGGTNSVSFALDVAGVYQLTDGTLQSSFGAGAVNVKGGTFNQFGGIVDMPVLLGRAASGTYHLSGGLRQRGPVHISSFDALGSGDFVQTGGTNVGPIYIAPYIPLWEDGRQRDSRYTLRGGEVRSTSVHIGAFGHFSQYGGVHYNESLALSNRYVCRRYSPGRAPDCKTVYATYGLSGGTLVSSNIWSQGSFSQSGGRLVVGHLQISGTGFSLSGGELLASQITIGSRFTDSAGLISDRARIQMNGGSWVARAGTRRLGALALGGGTVPTQIIFPPGNASLLEFASSASWSGSSTLIISNWSGSLAGGGAHQLRFGTDAAALSPAQIGQIYFDNPAGMSGRHSARMLADGEVVPAPIRIVAEKRPTELLLHWPTGSVVQTSTNINGPFEDVPNALGTSPLHFTDPARFFRIKPQEQ